jgi:hypothetical protein
MYQIGYVSFKKPSGFCSLLSRFQSWCLKGDGEFCDSAEYLKLTLPQMVERLLLCRYSQYRPLRLPISIKVSGSASLCFRPLTSYRHGFWRKFFLHIELIYRMSIPDHKTLTLTAFYRDVQHDLHMVFFGGYSSFLYRLVLIRLPGKLLHRFRKYDPYVPKLNER